MRDYEPTDLLGKSLLGFQTIRNLPHGDNSSRPRKILLFINTFGGKKKVLRFWEKDVQAL